MPGHRMPWQFLKRGTPGAVPAPIFIWNRFTRNIKRGWGCRKLWKRLFLCTGREWKMRMPS
ncbi:MAG TPA: hypothetical protein DCZ91_14755 [Lachnospiraceae bacterium]|nr:hypothetical protein [Lachnospiraceae bacterium]